MAYTPKPVRKALKRMQSGTRDRWKQIWRMIKNNKGKKIQITTHYERPDTISKDSERSKEIASATR